MKLNLMSSSPNSPKKSTASSKPRKHPASSTATSSGYYHNQQNANRKRAKRQVAGGLVAGLFGQPQQAQPVKMTPSGKKSTAQPRPAVTVPPLGIGPIFEPNDHDVLCGRGGRINAHVGNQRFRQIVQERKAIYLAPTTKKLEKAHIAAQIVQEIRARGGRFLKEEVENVASAAWYDIGDAKAIKKVGQALREDAQEVVKAANQSDDDNNNSNASAAKSVSVALPQGAMADTAYDPLPFHDPVAAAPSPHAMGPPPVPQHFARRGDVSGAAAAVMREESQGTLVFDQVFHPTTAVVTTEGSAISGLTNTVVSGTSALSTQSLTRRSGHPQHSGHNINPTFQSMRAEQLHHFRQALEGGQYPHQHQPAVPPQHRPGVMRAASWQEMSLADNMSWADHSLTGGGIPETASILSARSFYSHQMRNDNDSVMEILMQGSVNSGRRNSNNSSSNPRALYGAYRPAAAPVQRAMPSSGTSVADMSITSGGVESLGSIKSIMSNLSENLIALDLAEPSILGEL